MNNRDERWLTAFQTRELVKQRVGALTPEAIERVEFAIVDYSRTVLPARAMVILERDLTGTIISTQREASVPSWVWDLSDDWSFDWTNGTFHLAGDHEGRFHYLKIVGLQFSEQLLDQIWPVGTEMRDLTPSPGDATLHRKGGSPGKLPAWHAFWMAALRLAHEGELLDEIKFPTQAALRRHLLTQIEDALDDETIKPKVREIWVNFREG